MAFSLSLYHIHISLTSHACQADPVTSTSTSLHRGWRDGGNEETEAKMIASEEAAQLYFVPIHSPHERMETDLCPLPRYVETSR